MEYRWFFSCLIIIFSYTVDGLIKLDRATHCWWKDNFKYGKARFISGLYDQFEHFWSCRESNPFTPNVETKLTSSISHNREQPKKRIKTWSSRFQSKVRWQGLNVSKSFTITELELSIDRYNHFYKYEDYQRMKKTKYTNIFRIGIFAWIKIIKNAIYFDFEYFSFLHFSLTSIHSLIYPYSLSEWEYIWYMYSSSRLFVWKYVTRNK